MSILYKTTRFADTFTGDKETNVRVQLLSWDTLDTKAFVEYLATQNNISKGEAYRSLSIVLEGMEAVLKDGNILNLDDFGSISLNGNFCEDKEPDENHRAESIQVKNVVFKADKNLKKRISAAGFEKYNPKNQFHVNQYDYSTCKEYVNALKEKWQEYEDPECELEDYVDVSKYSNYDDYAYDIDVYRTRLE